MVEVLLRAASGTVTADDLALLDDGERARLARRAHPEPFVRAHALLRRLVAHHAGVDPAQVRFGRQCGACGSQEHGAPQVAGRADLSVSLSYCEDLALAALTEGSAVGCDVERVEGADFEGFARVTLADSERTAVETLTGTALLQARTIIWARKEAVLKATGFGLVVDPAAVVVSSPYATPSLVGWRAEQAAPGQVSLADVQLSDQEHRAAVAVLTGGPISLRWS